VPLIEGSDAEDSSCREGFVHWVCGHLTRMPSMASSAAAGGGLGRSSGSLYSGAPAPRWGAMACSDGFAGERCRQPAWPTRRRKRGGLETMTRRRRPSREEAWMGTNGRVREIFHGEVEGHFGL
jgi:hypothetical protein